MDLENDLYGLIEQVSNRNKLIQMDRAAELQNDLNISSLQLVEFITLIEKKYNIEFDFEDLNIEHFKNISSIIALLKKKLYQEK